MAYLYRVGGALSCLLNAMIGGDPSESLSLRIGRSIIVGGFWARVPIPRPLKAHFLRVARRTPADFKPSKYNAPEKSAQRWNTFYAGLPAGAVHTKGYISIVIERRAYLAHRLAWLYMTGEWPDSIDHINGGKADNRFENLRSVDNATNHRNMPRQRSNRSGATGVRWHKQVGKWNARIHTGGRGYSFGLYDRFEDAVAARKDAEERFGFHPNHGSLRPITRSKVAKPKTEAQTMPK